MENQFRKHLIFSEENIKNYLIAKKILGYCGDNVYIDKNVEFARFPEKIEIFSNVAIKEGAKICCCNEQSIISIGENTTIGYYTFIFSSEKIVIGADCLIAPFVYIVDSNHQIERSKLINQQENITAPIIIGNDVWIGSNVTILKGVSIGDGAVISAGAIVNRDVKDYSIVAGVPIKEIGERK